MSALTFQEMQDEALFNSFDPIKYRPRVKRWLNDAVNELCRRVGFVRVYEVATYDDEGTVALSSVLFEVIEVWEAFGPTASTADAFSRQAQWQLAPLPFDSPALTGDELGSLRYYVVEHAADTGGQPAVTLRLFPHQSSGYVAVTGRGRPVLMSQDTDTSGLGQEFDDILISFARSRAFRNEDDFEAAARWMADFDRGVKYASLSKRPQADGPIVTPGMWGDGDSAFRGGW